MIAVISLCISAAAFVLAALLPLWEKYAPPKVVLLPQLRSEQVAAQRCQPSSRGSPCEQGLDGL